MTGINAGDYSMIDLSRDNGTVLASDRANRASIGRSDLDASGRGSVVESRRVGGVPLIVTVGAPEPVVLATWRNTTRTMALMTFGLVTALVLLTLIVARLFERQDGTMRALRNTQREADEAARARTLLLEELQASEAALRDKSRVLELTLAHNDQGLLLVAPDGSVPICNRRAMELLELPDALMSGEPAFEEVVAYQRSIGEFPPGACSGGRLGLAVIPLERQIYERRRPNGTVLEIRTVPLPYGGMVRTFADITDRRRSEEQVRYLAQHDGLTRLVNRTVFRAALTDAIERAGYGQQRLAVHYLDLDGFKLVNDTYGHAAGDRLLVEVAARLRRAVREGDTVGRMGGDEFAVLQPLQAADDAEHLAQRILSAVSEPYELGTLTCTIGLSIGVSIFPDHAANAETLMRGADVALYRAKANGRGLFCLFDEQMDRRQQHIFEVEQELKRALPRREFFPRVSADRRCGDVGAGAFRGVDAVAAPGLGGRQSGGVHRDCGAVRDDRAAWVVGAGDGVPGGDAVAEGDWGVGERVAGAVQPGGSAGGGGGGAGADRAFGGATDTGGDGGCAAGGDGGRAGGDVVVAGDGGAVQPR